jgi:hypothetical protein
MIWERLFGVRSGANERHEPFIQRYSGDAIEQRSGDWVVVDRTNGLRTRMTGEEIAAAILGRELPGYELNRLVICGIGYAARALADGRWVIEFDNGGGASGMVRVAIRAAELAEAVRDWGANCQALLVRYASDRLEGVRSEA